MVAECISQEMPKCRAAKPLGKESEGAFQLPSFHSHTSMQSLGAPEQGEVRAKLSRLELGFEGG